MRNSNDYIKEQALRLVQTYKIMIGEEFFYQHSNNIIKARVSGINPDKEDGRGQYLVFKIEENEEMVVDFGWFRERKLIKAGIYGPSTLDNGRFLIGFFLFAIKYFDSVEQMNQAIENDYQEYFFHEGYIYLKKNVCHS